MNKRQGLSKMGPHDFPRRNCIYLLEPEEKTIYDLVQDVEKMGCHPLLTEVVTLLGTARDRLADWLEMPNE